MTRPVTSRIRLRPLAATLAVGLLVAGTGARAASLSAFAGAVGGAGNGSIAGGCTTYGPPSDLSFFSGFGAGLQVLGGNAACGYSGGWSTHSATTGSVTNSASLAPTVLGNPGYAESWGGSAQSRASYGSLGASAHGQYSGSPVSFTSGTTIAASVGAAQFSDTLTAAVPTAYTDLSHSGFVRYSFAIDGSQSTPGPYAAYFGGESLTAFNLQQDGGPVYTMMNAHTVNGDVGTIYGAPPTGGGWTLAPGSVSGGSVFTLMLPVDLTKSWNVQAGLIVNAYGNADATFYNSAKLVGLDLYDVNGNAISGFSLSSASGTNYLAPVPEPATGWLLLAGAVALAGRARRGLRRIS